jgi:hypothetical protein
MKLNMEESIRVNSCRKIQEARAGNNATPVAVKSTAYKGIFLR